ncbi:DNA mismatch endonuclease Vsr [Candidatus Poribacteria bacterium]|nr:DNA mismatch endonuclease Vsr [Candidatus Poribacteria bacterium]
MTDTYDTATRSEVMRRVKGRDTYPEMLLRKTLFAVGLRGWRCHRSDLPGRPDLAFGKARLAIFVDGAFWHGHPSKYWKGRSSAYWDNKIARNIERDRIATESLLNEGWSVIRFWDFEVESDPLRAATFVQEALQEIKAGRRVAKLREMTLAKGPTLAPYGTGQVAGL